MLARPYNGGSAPGCAVSLNNNTYANIPTPQKKRRAQGRFPLQPLRRAPAKPMCAARPRRGIYLLPNAFTTAALFCGFYAIVMAMNQRFDHACWAVFIAMILDGLDGRVARLTNTQSEFGAQYDSCPTWCPSAPRRRW
jgi:CDP-diacylglycerol--serine O-phosphatidyltransferase